MGRPLKDLTGLRFGRLIVIKRHYQDFPRDHDTQWLCLCECGNSTTVRGGNLKSGHSRSCGCNKTMRGIRNPSYRHGQTLTPEYRAYQSAKTRCTNPSVICFPEYGGRGIEFKFSSFDQWIADVGPRPTSQHSIDRINNDKGYEPGNLKWATKSEQLRNRRKSKIISKFSDVELLNEVSRRTFEYGLCGC